MKKMIAMLFFLICIIIYADEDYCIEDSLYDRGYTKFDPREQSYTHIYADCYNEIFLKDFRFEKTGIRLVRINIDDGFEYNLFYILEREDLPNIIVIVYLENNGKIWGFYKKNISLDGIIMPVGTKAQENLLVFF